MKRKTIIFPIVSILLAGIAHAAEEGGILWMIESFGRFVFTDIPQMGDIGFKFLFFIIVFAVLHWGTSRIPNINGRTAGVISFILAITTTILLNDIVIKAIFSTYAFVFLYLIIFSFVFIFWFLISRLPDDSRFLRAFLCVGAGIALFFFASWVKGAQFFIAGP